MKLKCLGVRYKFFMFSLLRLLDEKSKKEKKKKKNHTLLHGVIIQMVF